MKKIILIYIIFLISQNASAFWGSLIGGAIGGYIGSKNGSVEKEPVVNEYKTYNITEIHKSLPACFLPLKNKYGKLTNIDAHLIKNLDTEYTYYIDKKKKVIQKDQIREVFPGFWNYPVEELIKLQSLNKQESSIVFLIDNTDILVLETQEEIIDLYKKKCLESDVRLVKLALMKKN